MNDLALVPRGMSAAPAASVRDTLPWVAQAVLVLGYACSAFALPATNENWASAPRVAALHACVFIAVGFAALVSLRTLAPPSLFPFTPLLAAGPLLLCGVSNALLVLGLGLESWLGDDTSLLRAVQEHEVANEQLRNEVSEARAASRPYRSDAFATDEDEWRAVSHIVRAAHAVMRQNRQLRARLAAVLPGVDAGNADDLVDWAEGDAEPEATADAAGVLGEVAPLAGAVNCSVARLYVGDSSTSSTAEVVEPTIVAQRSVPAGNET